MKQIMKQGWAVMTALLLTAGIVFTACTQNKNNNETTETETEAEWEPVQTEVSVDDLKALAEVLPKYYVYSGFHDGLILVSDNETNLYGFIDKTGKLIIKPQYSEARDFSDGIAAVAIGGDKYGNEEFMDGGTLEIIENSTTDVDELAMSAKVYTECLNIIIETPIEQKALISDIAGHVREVNLQSGRNEIPVNANGIYIVRIREKTTKLMLK